MVRLISNALIAVALLFASAVPAYPATPPPVCVENPVFEGAAIEAILIETPENPRNLSITDLPTQFEALVAKTPATQAQISVLYPGGQLQSAQVGAISADQPMWWASASKMMTAAIILQMVEEEKLALNTTIFRWAPDLPNAEIITIDHLLTHTSGLFSFNADKAIQRMEGYKSPKRLLASAKRMGPDFCPGANWNYSNTGYLLLGLIAEDIDNMPFAEVVDRRIAKPLGLTSISVMTPGGPDLVPAPVGKKAFQTDDIASIGGAGAIVSNSADAVRFLSALFFGDVLPDDRVDWMLSQTYQMYGTTMRYGRGLMVIDVPHEQNPRRWIGHSGGSPDGKGLIVMDQTSGLIIAIALNTQAPAEAILNALLTG